MVSLTAVVSLAAYTTGVQVNKISAKQRGIVANRLSIVIVFPSFIDRLSYNNIRWCSVIIKNNICHQEQKQNDRNAAK